MFPETDFYEPCVRTDIDLTEFSRKSNELAAYGLSFEILHASYPDIDVYKDVKDMVLDIAMRDHGIPPHNPAFRAIGYFQQEMYPYQTRIAASTTTIEREQQSIDRIQQHIDTYAYVEAQYAEGTISSEDTFTGRLKKGYTHWKIQRNKQKLVEQKKNHQSIIDAEKLNIYRYKENQLMFAKPLLGLRSNDSTQAKSFFRDEIYLLLQNIKQLSSMPFTQSSVDQIKGSMSAAMHLLSIFQPLDKDQSEKFIEQLRSTASSVNQKAGKTIIGTIHL